MADLVWLDVELCKHIARNSPKVKQMERIAAEGIYALIYETAPHAEPSYPLNYRDNFRIEHRHFPTTQGHATYLIAERFQWRWIEYGWTEWRDNIKHPGKYVMSKALRAYGYGDIYGDYSDLPGRPTI